MSSSNSSASGTLSGLLNGDAGAAQSTGGITTKAFALNVAANVGLFVFEICGFFLLKSLDVGRRIYQPKTFLVQERLRVATIPVSPMKWILGIFAIEGEDLKVKCGLDGYLFIRLIRTMIVLFVPSMVILVTILFPVNYVGGKDTHPITIGGQRHVSNVTGLDTLSWQNVAPSQTDRYWAHLVCALMIISWTLYIIYHEKLHFIDARQRYLTSPEHRLKASARTILVTNIPTEYRSEEALKALYDVFVDNDDRSKLQVWVNRDYKSLKTLVDRRRKLVHVLEKHELKLLRAVNKQKTKGTDGTATEDPMQVDLGDSSSTVYTREEREMVHGSTTHDVVPTQILEAVTSADKQSTIHVAFEKDCQESGTVWAKYLKGSEEPSVSVVEDGAGGWKEASRRSRGPKKQIPKSAWLRAEIARLSIQIEEVLPHLDDDVRFKRQNSAFIQFDRQMAAHMAFSMVSHHKAGRMAPRFLDVAPHEILWPNMGVTSLGRFIRTCLALVIFLVILVFWGLPTTFLGFMSQLDSLRATTTWLAWLKPWPSWVISAISGPVTSILLALLIQLLVPALCRKLAVLTGVPTRSTREVVTQSFYFTFLFVELVLVTSISSGIIATVPAIIANPSTIPTTLATNLPKAANYFFNYLVVQALSFSGSVLFQYLRLLYITTIWPWFTQTPREEAFLQTTIPHQMWGNVYPLFTNFAVIALIYSVTSPLILIIASVNFSLFWIAYRHNYFYVQRNKVDTHGALFNNALSQILAGVYVLEATLIGLFFLVRNTDDQVACSPQAIVMIVVLCLTAVYHYILEQQMRPLYDLIPVTLEDQAAEAERKRFLLRDPSVESSEQDAVVEHVQAEASDTERRSRSLDLDEKSTIATGLLGGARSRRGEDMTRTAANASHALLRLRKKTAIRLAAVRAQTAASTGVSRRRKVGNMLSEAIAAFPDELADLSGQERDAELKAAYQNPVTRVPAPIIWIPEDLAGVSKDLIQRAKKYGKYLQYNDTGAYLTKTNKCEITQLAPDVRPDWLLDWVL